MVNIKFKWEFGIGILEVACCHGNFGLTLVVQLCTTRRFIFVLRHILAVVHFNFNLQREVKKNADGVEGVKVSYPKFKNGEATVRNARITQNFGKHSFHNS